MSRLRIRAVALSFVLVLGCSSPNSTPDNGSGGKSSGNGGATAEGGKLGSGGAMSSGGAPAGGSSSSGGTNANGGSANGGSNTSGGASGGTNANGGSANGGASSKGGASNGGSANGGSNSSGGASNGGRSAQGGSSNGGSNTGGSNANGGGGASGGNTANGGSGGGSGSFNPCPTNGDVCKILPLGDSITYGLITVAADKPNGKDSNGGYRLEFFSKAQSAKQKIVFTGSQQNGPDMVAGVAFSKYHEGHSGFTIDDSTGNGINDKSVLDPGFKTTPHIVLLHIGTNDVYSSKGMQAGMPDRLGKLLDELTTRAPNALIVVAKIVPLSSQNTYLTNYNNNIPSVVASRVSAGKHIIIVDTFTGFKSSMLSADGVHPNQSGYDFMGDTFYAAVNNLLPK